MPRAEDYVFTITDRDASRGGRSTARDRAVDAARDATLRRDKNGRWRDFRGRFTGTDHIGGDSHLPHTRPTAGSKGARARAFVTDELLGGGLAGAVVADAVAGDRPREALLRSEVYRPDASLPYGERLRRTREAGKIARASRVGRLAEAGALATLARKQIGKLTGRALGGGLGSIRGFGAAGGATAAVYAAGYLLADPLEEVIARQRSGENIRGSDWIYETGAAAGRQAGRFGLGAATYPVRIGAVPAGFLQSIQQILRGRDVKTPQQNAARINRDLDRMVYRLAGWLGFEPEKTEEMLAKEEAEVAKKTAEAEIARQGESARAQIRTQTGARLFDLGLDIDTAQRVFIENEKRMETIMGKRIEDRQRTAREEIQHQLAERLGG